MREREKKKHRVSCNETGQTFSPVSHQELKLPLKKKWTNTNAEYINKCCINGKGITSFLWLHAEQVFNIGDITCRPLIFFFFLLHPSFAAVDIIVLHKLSTTSLEAHGSPQHDTKTASTPMANSTRMKFFTDKIARYVDEPLSTSDGQHGIKKQTEHDERS